MLPLSGGPPLSLSSDEAIRVLVGARRWAESRTRFTARQIPVERDAPLPDTPAALRKALGSRALLVAARHTTRPELDRATRGQGLGDLLQRFHLLRRSTRGADKELAELLVVNYLKGHPGAVDELVDLVARDGRLDEPTRALLLLLIARAGHATAQHALAGAAFDPLRSPALRRMALAHLHAVEVPTASLGRRLRDFALASSLSQDPLDQELRRMALYALGALAGKDGAPDALRREAMEHLSSSLAASHDPADQSTFLAALGNLADPGILAHVEPFFSSDLPELRTAAFGALRRLRDPAAVETLTTHYEAEPSDDVRLAALGVLARLPQTAASLAWVEQEALRSDQPREMALCARILGQSLGSFPDKEAALRRLLRADVPTRVKREIYRHLAPRR